MEEREGEKGVAITFRWPSKVAILQAESAELEVTAADAHWVHALVTELGKSRGSAQLELALLLVNLALTTGKAALVAFSTANA